MDYDWETLDELRATYLDGTAGKSDYWSGDRLLSGYDATFARRIAWKWQWVFGELDKRNWTPPAGLPLYDWGCGTGVAAREFLTKYPGSRTVYFHDRSHRAARWAAAAARREFPDTEFHTGQAPEGEFILLLSHVLTELNDHAEAALLETAAQAAAILWVEPGTSAASNRLVKLREKLRETFHPVAPCTHRAVCGLLADGKANDWCHFHAPPPNIVFTDSDWVHFGRIMGIDLRSLPVSYLVLDRQSVAPPPPHTVRVIGHHRLLKGHAMLDGCDATGVHERRFTKRTDPVLFRAMNKGRVSTLQHWELEGNEIRVIRELPENQASTINENT